MHRLQVAPGGWTPGMEGVVFIEQTPGDIIFLTAADTEIQALSVALKQWSYPASVRAVNLLNLQQQLTIDTYAEEVLEKAKVIVIRLLGGRSYWSYGLEVIKELAERLGIHLYLLPGDEQVDLDLMENSTVPLTQVHTLWRYLVEGGPENLLQGLNYIYGFQSQQPIENAPVQKIERWGTYTPQGRTTLSPDNPQCGLIFYRAHYLSGNLEPIDALVSALAERGIRALPVFVQSLKEPEILEALEEYFQDIDLLLNTTGFSIDSAEGKRFYQALDIPIFQVILASSSQEIWEAGTQGLSPRDVAMNVALPEIDGRIITRAISFKSSEVAQDAQLETPVVTYQSEPTRVHFVAALAAHWIRLRRTPVQARKIALILSNYPTKDGRLANGVGLDTPNSCIEILKALSAAGYCVEAIPTDGDDLIRTLTRGVTNDQESFEGRSIDQAVTTTAYQAFFSQLPQAVQAAVTAQWGAAPGVHKLRDFDQQKVFPVPGIQLGNIFVGIQPSRGYEEDPAANYHSPDLVPPHPYFAFYHWLRHIFEADAVVHVGKHGNLEWLPGKGLALSEECFPEAIFGPTPNFYPFIVNDPGEGAQAKRRSQAVVIDHLIPPMTRAETYGPLQELERLIDEYYEAAGLDPTRLKVIEQHVRTLITQHALHQDLGIELSTPVDHWLMQMDGYLCELKEAQIRDGLHIFGKAPEGTCLVDLLVALARNPNPYLLNEGSNRGITQFLADKLGLDFDPLTVDFATPWTVPLSAEVRQVLAFEAEPRIAGDVVEALEKLAAQLVGDNLSNLSPSPSPQAERGTGPGFTPPLRGRRGGWGERFDDFSHLLDNLLPKVQQTHQEIDHLLKGLDGRYVPPGPSGAPTRGRLDVLPTGRNFYSLDSRAIPTQTSWDIGRRAAEALIERHLQDHGEYPTTLGLSVWGTSTMRTGGDDIAQALALMGVQPVWDRASGRVIDFEVITRASLGRPRVDVMLRVSGFFRDAFAHVIDLFHQAVEAIAQLEESPTDNPLRLSIQKDQTFWQQEGLSLEQAQEQATYRVFGSKPGAYGAGLQGLIDQQNWTTSQDLAQAYVNWGGYAYGRGGKGKTAHAAFSRRLSKLELVLHNQDNREHDLLDSDDYYQFQGGMIAAVRVLSEKQPKAFFGDHSQPAKPKIKTLEEEIAKVFRSRVVNPKWIRGVMRHGYKGAFEMAATVDYLFAYDATAQVVTDWMYEGIAEAYLLDPAVKTFLSAKNPWALRDMAERLLEAHQRAMWQTTEAMIHQLQNLLLEAELEVERAIQ
jgi:cobaltochelatase CobN